MRAIADRTGSPRGKRTAAALISLAALLLPSSAAVVRRDDGFRRAYDDARKVFYTSLREAAAPAPLLEADRRSLRDAEREIPRLFEQLMSFYFFLYPAGPGAAPADRVRPAARSMAADLVRSISRAPEAPGDTPLGAILRSAGVFSRRGLPPLRSFLRPLRKSVRRDWMWRTLDTAGAHRIARGRGVRIAILDTGVDVSLLEIRTRCDLARDFLAGASPLEASGFPHDWDGHGTSVAVTAALTAPEAELAIAKIYDMETMSRVDPTCWSAAIAAAALRWAADNGAGVVSLSAAFLNDSHNLREAVKACWERNIVVVAAQGHRLDGEDGDEAPAFYPAAYPWTIAVGGVERADGELRVWKGSAPSDRIDVVAPAAAVRVESPVFLTRGFRATRLGSGNSLATPAIAGTVALMLSAMDPAVRADLARTPGRLVETVRRLLRENASRDRLGPEATARTAGAGLIDVPAAVRAAKGLKAG